MFFLQDKSETQEVLKKFLRMTQNEFDDNVKEILRDDVDDEILLQAAKKQGMQTINEQLKEMLKKGDTSLDEVIRLGLR